MDLTLHAIFTAMDSLIQSIPVELAMDPVQSVVTLNVSPPKPTMFVELAEVLEELDVITTVSPIWSWTLVELVEETQLARSQAAPSLALLLESEIDAQI